MIIAITIFFPTIIVIGCVGAISLLKDRITYIHIDSLLERKAILITADLSSCYLNSLCKIPRNNAVAIPTYYYK
jgi:hypothetical protein